jgi:hypothetical protein
MKSPRLLVPAKGTTNPLTKHSLLGSASKLREHAALQKPLLGRVCLSGQFTIWFGRFGRGKSLLFYFLLIEAIQDHRIQPASVFIINADDNSAGLADKAEITDDLGVNVLVPGYKEFSAAILLDLMLEVIERGAAQDTFVILDTLKKFVDVMDKKAIRAFNIVFRNFVMAGGTLLALAHTNKRTGADGKPVPEGAGDLSSDIDCSFILDQASKDGDEETVIKFTVEKNRGGGVAREEYYAFDPNPDLTYAERLASVRKIDPEDDRYAAMLDETSDEDLVIANIETCFEHGIVTKMEIVRMAGLASQVSRRVVLGILEKYTGDDPAAHRWNFTVREHGRKVYAPLAGRTEVG